MSIALKMEAEYNHKKMEWGYGFEDMTVVFYLRASQMTGKKKKYSGLQAPSIDKNKRACVIAHETGCLDVLNEPMKIFLLMIVWTENSFGGKREN